jgi:hypothetical protein
MKKYCEKILIEKLLFPFLIVVATAIAGSIVGYHIQNRQFRQTTLFKAKFDLLFESRKEAIELLVEFKKIFAQIKTDENHIIEQFKNSKTDTKAIDYYCDEGFFDNLILELKSIKPKIDFLETNSKGIGFKSSTDTIITNSISSFKDNLGDYITCLQERHNDCGISCSYRHIKLTEKLQEVVDAYTKQLHILVKSKNNIQ